MASHKETGVMEGQTGFGFEVSSLLVSGLPGGRSGLRMTGS